MSLFVIACGLVAVAALAAELHAEEGVLIVPPAVWYAIIGALALWLVVLAG